MSSDDSDIGSALLDEFWHATARAPRRYPGDHEDIMSDMIGAVLKAAAVKKATETKPATRTAVTRATTAATARASDMAARPSPATRPVAARAPMKASTAKAVTMAAKPTAAGRIAAAAKSSKVSSAEAHKAGNRAVAAGRALSRMRPKAGAKLIAAGQQLMNKASKAASTASKKLSKKLVTLRGDEPDDTGASDMEVMAIVRELHTETMAINAVAVVGEAVNSILGAVNQLTAMNAADLASAGKSIADRGTALINGFDLNTGNASTTLSTANAVRADASAWLQQAQAMLAGGGATSPAAFDPGTSGGGGGGSAGGGDSSEPADGGGAPGGEEGGGGGGEDTGEPVEQDAESEAVARFRQSGGEWDPFAEESDESAASADPGADAEGAAPEESSESDASEDADTGDGDTESSEDADPFVDNLATFEERRRAAASEDENQVLGSFEWYDIFNPAGAVIRTYAEQPTGETLSTTPSGAAKQGAPSPEAAQRLAAAHQRLAEAQRRMSAFRASQAQASAPAPASAPVNDFAQRLAESRRRMGMDGDQEESVMGFDVNEMADIVLEAYEEQITDAPPDPLRERASAHRGASYLSPHYPPHGASSGQEGGSMRPEETIEVFGHYHNAGLDVLGDGVPAGPRKKLTQKVAAVRKAAVQPRANFVVRKAPLTGRKYTSLVLHGPKKGDHKTSIANATTAGKRAVSAGMKLKAAAAKARPSTAPSKISAKAKPPAKSTVHGLADLVFGAVLSPKQKPAAPKGKGAPHAHYTTPQLRQLADKVIKTGKDALAHAKNHQHLIDSNAAHLKAAAKANRSKTYLGGCDDAADYEATCTLLGAYCEVLGDAVTDPSYADPYADPSMDTTDTSAPAAAAADPYYGLGPPPTVAPPLTPGVDFMPDPGPEIDQTPYSSDPSRAPGAELPLGYVLYDGSHGFPGNSVGSFNRYYGASNNHDGFELNVGGWWGGAIHHGSGWAAWRGSSHDTVEDNEARDLSENHRDPVQLQATSIRYGWGPLVGNPDLQNVYGKWTYGLRFDAGGNQWFWYRDKAPSWATAADDQAHLNQAILDYKANLASAAADAAAQAAADKLEADQAAALQKQQAAEDAANQRRMDQEQKEAQHQAELQAVADQAAAQQAAAEDERSARQAQSQVDVESRQAQSQADIESKAMLTQAAIDRQAMEEAAAIEQRAVETAAHLDAMAPPPDEASTDGSEAFEEPAEEEEASSDAFYDEAGMPAADFEQAPMEPIEEEPTTVLGLRGLRRHLARRYAR